MLPSTRAAEENRWKSFFYLDWPIKSVKKRCYWREVFALLSDTLGNGSNGVLVHCRNGITHSCFVVYAFLRLRHGLDHTFAVALVNRRVNVLGFPLFQYDKQNHDLLQWFEANLREPSSADSSIMRWHAGGI